MQKKYALPPLGLLSPQLEGRGAVENGMAQCNVNFQHTVIGATTIYHYATGPGGYSLLWAIGGGSA